jgi:hypothetical protein
MITSSVADRQELHQVQASSYKYKYLNTSMSLHNDEQDEVDPLDRLGAQVHPPGNVPDAPLLLVPFGGDDFEPNYVFTGPPLPSVPLSISFPSAGAAVAMPAQPAHVPVPQHGAPPVPVHVPVLPTLPMDTLVHRPPDTHASANATVVHVTNVQVHMLDRRKQFLVFIKILLKHLEKTANESTRRAVQRILQECTVKNRQGDPNYQPLHLAAESRILPVVGPLHWNRSVQYLNLYLQKQAQARTTRHENAHHATTTNRASPPPLSVPI